MDSDLWLGGQAERSHQSEIGDNEVLNSRTAILAAKLRPPHARDGIIPRPQLVDRMLAHDSEQLVAVVAPPGYGKTTLLAEWASKRRGDVAWLSIDEGDNDPSALLAATAIAMNGVHPIDTRALAAVTARTATIPTALSTLTSALAPTRSMTLVLDNVDAVANNESLDLIVELIWRLPAGSQLAYASRSPLPLPVSLLRSRGEVVEIGSADLAMDHREAQALLAAAGAELSPAEVDNLLEQTEGWPAGIYLAALASRARPHAAGAFAIRGDDVWIGDYFRTQILSRLPAATVEFLTRTSVLDQLCGPLCDAVLDAHGSQRMLESLEASNLLLVPLDRHRTWYRYHRLFRDLLAIELARREPELVPGLHVRAARWLHSGGMPEPAIRQAQRGDDPDLVVQLVVATTQPAYAAGRATDVRSWLEWFRANDLIDRYPHVAVLGATVDALSGRPAASERWAAAAEAAEIDPEHGDRTLLGMLAYMRGLMCRDGAAQMRADAQTALELLDPANGLRPGAFLIEALSHHVEGDFELADQRLAHAFDVASYAGAMPAAAESAALRAMIAIRNQEWDDARTLAGTALSIVETGLLHEYLEAAAVYAVAARTAAHRGDVPAAHDHLVRAVRLRPLLTYAAPGSALVQLEIARAYLQLADPVGARTVLREVRDLLHQRPNLGIVASEANELRQALDTMRHGQVAASALTTAELRLLPFLATHLSFPEIGNRLHVSRHTVKTQAMSVYRKFGVSSRSEAIQHAQDVGLLGR
jgi:LuxR family transcriptional regulator, maltose regulon positive regulatory protein